MGKGVCSQKTDGEPANHKTMDDKDKKPSLGETVALLAIAAVLTAALYAIVTGLWKCATATQKRARVCVPILLWPLVFVPVQIIGIILMSMTGLANFSSPSYGNPATPEQEFVNGVVTWSDVVIAFVISLLISRRVVRRIDEETAPPESLEKRLQRIDVTKFKKIQPLPSGLTREERRKKYLKDFGRPPFYIDTRKWLKDNFKEDVYIGPDLTEYGFDIEGQKIKPWEQIKYRYIFIDDLERHLRSWNFAMARKLGLIESKEPSKPHPKRRSKSQPDDWGI